MTLANSYIDSVDATAYLTNIVGSESWLSLDENAKNASLIQSTQTLDASFDWAGAIASDTQDLRWPRAGVYDRDGRSIASDIIPNAIKNATALLALHLIQAGGVKSVSNNVKSLKVGPISIGLDSSESINDQIVPSYIISLMNALGLYTGPRNSDSAYNVKAYR